MQFLSVLHTVLINHLPTHDDSLILKTFLEAFPLVPVCRDKSLLRFDFNF